MNRSTKAIGFTAVCASAALAIAPAAGAHAGPSTVQITTVSPGAWLSDSSMPVAYTATDLAAFGKCSPLAVTIWWKSSGDKLHHHTVRSSYMSVQAGSMSIPGSTIWPGTLRYRITARQYCRNGNSSSKPLVGRSPSSGWYKTTIK